MGSFRRTNHQRHHHHPPSRPLRTHRIWIRPGHGNLRRLYRRMRRSSRRSRSRYYGLAHHHLLTLPIPPRISAFMAAPSLHTNRRRHRHNARGRHCSPHPLRFVWKRRRRYRRYRRPSRNPCNPHYRRRSGTARTLLATPMVTRNRRNRRMHRRCTIRPVRHPTGRRRRLDWRALQFMAWYRCRARNRVLGPSPRRS